MRKTGVLEFLQLHFEDYLDWRGILIEANPVNAQHMRANRPLAARLALGVCDEQTHNFTFVGNGAVGATVNNYQDSWGTRKALPQFTVRCMPLGGILKKVGVDFVDFWSLDVEGAEMQVLKTHDWANIPIRVLMYECESAGPR